MHILHMYHVFCTTPTLTRSVLPLLLVSMQKPQSLVVHPKPAGIFSLADRGGGTLHLSGRMYLKTSLDHQNQFSIVGFSTVSTACACTKPCFSSQVEQLNLCQQLKKVGCWVFPLLGNGVLAVHCKSRLKNVSSQIGHRL